MHIYKDIPPYLLILLPQMRFKKFVIPNL